MRIEWPGPVPSPRSIVSLIIATMPAVASAATEVPVVRTVVILGAEHTQASLVRAEIRVREGEALDSGDVRETRRRLEETDLFSRVDIRIRPVGTLLVDVEVELADRHGLGGLSEVGARLAVDLFKKRITTRYANIAGRGVTAGIFYRWERTQPQLGFELDSVRPFGLGVNVHAGALTGRPTYDLDDDGQDLFMLRSRGGDFGLQRVVGSRTTAGAGLHYRDRTYTITRPDTPSGRVSALHAGLEHRIVDGSRHRLDLALVGMRASSAWGSDLSFTRHLARATYRGALAPPEIDIALQPSEVAAQVHWGRGGASTPLDEMFAPGAASNMELPLRAHRQKRGGVLGRSPIGRTLALLNAEWRHRLVRKGTFQIGTVLFYDGARIGDTAQGPSSVTLHDVGFGIRIGIRRTMILRGDIAYSPTDGKNALTAGLGHAF
jgi:outer membrane protein assembly factor BamA